MRESRLDRWLPLLFAMMTAVEGWLVLGSLAQSTLIAAALLKRLRGKLLTAASGTDELA